VPARISSLFPSTGKSGMLDGECESAPDETGSQTEISTSSGKLVQDEFFSVISRRHVAANTFLFKRSIVMIKSAKLLLLMVSITFLANACVVP
jgi:hypothetical protein